MIYFVRRKVMKMIDLHLHTTYSDGADSLIEVLKKAEKLKLEYISITDHDTCNGYNELKGMDISRYYTGKIIPGVEIKCGYKSNLIELLGYNIDPNVINKYMDKYHEKNSKEKLQQKYFDIQYETCIKKGLKMSKKEEVEFNNKTDWASVKIYEEIKKHEENREKLPKDLWADFMTFSKKYCGDINSEFHIDKTKDYPTTQEAVELIKSAGGLVFIPHIFIYKWAKDKKQLLQDILDKYEIDGIECMHSDFTTEQIEYLLEFTKTNHYYRSGGSDYHGVNKPSIEMAIGKGNLNIPSELIKEWVMK